MLVSSLGELSERTMRSISLEHPKPMLLIRDDQPTVGKRNPILRPHERPIRRE